MQEVEKAKRRGLLWKVVVVSLVAHAAALLVVGPLVIFSHLFKNEVQFEPAEEPLRRIEPRKLEFKVKVQEQRKQSGRPKVQPRMMASRVADLSLPAIDVEVAPITSKALPTMRNFNSMGLGAGLASGRGQGGLGVGESSASFFGVRAHGERLAILVDVSGSMLDDKRGGLQGFKTIKTEITRVVRGLSPGTFFNVITFSSGVDIFQPKMVLASDDNKNALISWLGPYNTASKSDRYGVRLNNYKPKTRIDSYRALDGTTRLDLALTAALEQGADTVLVLTDGVPQVRKDLSTKEWQAWQKKYHNAKEKRKLAREIEKWDRAISRENATRASKGLPPKVMEGGPGLRQPLISLPEVLTYISSLQKELYKSKKRKPCKIHVVGYETNEEEEAFLREMARDNHGRFRRLKNNIKPIKHKDRSTDVNNT